MEAAAIVQPMERRWVRSATNWAAGSDTQPETYSEPSAAVAKAVRAWTGAAAKLRGCVPSVGTTASPTQAPVKEIAPVTAALVTWLKLRILSRHRVVAKGS